MDVLIKGINEDAWKRFKVGAIENGMRLGEYFNDIIEESSTYEKKKGNWESIKRSKGSLVDFTDEEITEMKSHMKKIKKTFKFRY